MADYEELLDSTDALLAKFPGDEDVESLDVGSVIVSARTSAAFPFVLSAA